MMAINAYLDFTEYEDPIKHFLDEVHYANLDKTRNKKADIFVMKGEVEMQDKIIDVGESKSGYFSLVETVKPYEDSFNNEDTYLTINIKYDPKYYAYSREVFGLFEFLCDIGSLTQALMIIGYILVSFVTKRLYVAQVLKDIYHAKFQRVKSSTTFKEDAEGSPPRSSSINGVLNTEQALNT